MTTLIVDDIPPVAFGFFRIEVEDEKIQAWVNRHSTDYVLDKPALVFLKDEAGKDVAYIFLHGTSAPHLVRQMRVQQDLQAKIARGAAGGVVGLESALPRLGKR